MAWQSQDAEQDPNERCFCWLGFLGKTVTQRSEDAAEGVAWL